MGRILKNINANNELVVKNLLTTLVENQQGVEEYRKTFFSLGCELGKIIAAKYKNLGHVLVVCAAEDADWLANGLLDFCRLGTSIAVYWTDRKVICENPKIEISPIVKSYIDSDADSCDTMIVVKSIISTSCVVKTQLNNLMNRCNPSQIIIAAPVMFKDADKVLKEEFPKSIAEKFSFVSFAIDDEKNNDGIILPGIGGMVYSKLGLGDVHQKNAYMPNLVRYHIMEPAFVCEDIKCP